MIMKYLPIIVFPLLLSACSNEDKFDVGYDGYVAGYNTTCEIRATMVEGDWDNQSYSRGYQKGYETGSQDCKNKN